MHAAPPSGLIGNMSILRSGRLCKTVLTAELVDFAPNLPTSFQGERADEEQNRSRRRTRRERFDRSPRPEPTRFRHAGSLIDTAGSSLQVNAAGHAAMINSIALSHERQPSGIVLYDGASYSLVAARGDHAPGRPDWDRFAFFSSLLLNDNDDVVFTAGMEPIRFGRVGIF